jgi:hypothetical protein
MEHDSPSEPRCHNCGAAISWRPVTHRGHIYCCGGCAQGGPCYCSYDLTTRDWPRPATPRHGGRVTPAAVAAQRRFDYEETN